MPDPDAGGSPTVVYIHGAGRQDPVDRMKEALDRALFSGRGPSVVARYSQVVWKEHGLTDDRELAIEAIAASPALARVRAAQIVAATPRRGDGTLRPNALEEAQQLVATFLEHADEVQAEVARCETPELVASLRFGFLAGIFGSDVVGYLFLDWGHDMRAPVIEVLRNVEDPVVVVAHSLGTILGYDVLCLPEFAGRRIPLLLTAGSPLGLEKVRTQMNDGRGPGRLPGGIPLWSNWADRWDPYAGWDRTLADDFMPPPRIEDHPDVDNPRWNNHDLPGYLGLEPVRVLVRSVIDTGSP